VDVAALANECDGRREDDTPEPLENAAPIPVGRYNRDDDEPPGEA